MKKTIYLAGGCFWGTQKYLDQLQGVLTTEVGFANGNTEAPPYEEVCHNNTGPAEAVRVEYDAQQMPLARLLKFYFASINPTSLNRQGEDSGSQYRTGIYYVDAADEEVIREALRELSTHYQQPVMVECCRLRNYYPAEEYHQKYLEKNPTGYCHLDPALFDAAYDLSRKEPEEK